MYYSYYFLQLNPTLNSTGFIIISRIILPENSYSKISEFLYFFSWGLHQELQRMDYCNEVRGFINYATSNPRNITGFGIKCPCKRCKNKNFLDLDVVMMHLLQNEFIKEYLCWYAHGEPFVPHKTIVEKMVRSTSTASNVYRVVDDNCNPCRTMVMDVMRMNQGHAG